MSNVIPKKFPDRVENKHGWMLVSHALAYVTASKNGISEPEIEDLISLDDKVLDDIYQYHLPPTRRIPPLLWTRVRYQYHLPVSSTTTRRIPPFLWTRVRYQYNSVQW